MKETDLKNELFQTSQLTILVSFTVFSVILMFETFLMMWETWPLIPIVIGLIVSWMLHLKQSFSGAHRVWIYSAFIMFTFFFYGSHITSVFDTASVMSVVLILYTMTGIKPLITFLQFLYYVTMGYGLVMMWQSGVEFDSLVISRSVLHIAVITAVSSISRTIINKWIQVLDKSHEEIDKLTDATDRLNDFLANVSHEIRTPVNAVIGLTSISIDNETDEEKLTNLISVRNAGRRVTEQISDILDYTEIDRGKLTNNYEDYMLSSVLNDLVEELRPYKPRELELVIDVDPAIPSVMNTDISKLRKILRHLIINGLKYTREGGVYVRLVAMKQPYGVNLLIKVTDTGIGMSEEEAERIFEGYYQVDSGRTRQGSGLGLGMTIVSGFAESLGGFMTIESKSGEGTTVSVSLPQRVVEDSSCMSVENPEKLCLGLFLHLDKFGDPNVREYYNSMVHNIVAGLRVQMHWVDNLGNLKKLLSSVRLSHLFIGDDEYLSCADELTKLSKDMVIIVVADVDIDVPAGSGIRVLPKPFYCFPVEAVLNSSIEKPETDEGIMRCPGVEALVVDDEPMNLSVAKNILRRYGMNVTTAPSGRDSIDLCRERDFDIVFMDHMMPGMDGVETMKHIRANGAKDRRSFPIVALTANAVSTAKEMFLSVGFDGFVSKPIELLELERVLKKVLPKTAVIYEKKAPAPSPEPAAPPAPEEPPLPEETEKPSPDASDAELPQEAPAADSASVYEKLAEYGIDTEVGLSYCLDDTELYDSLLLQFVDETAEKQSSMQKFFEEQDLRNYQILVHALKSTAKMIGHEELSEKAKALEFAAREDRPEFIAENHGEMMSEYKALSDRIAEAFGGGISE